MRSQDHPLMLCELVSAGAAQVMHEVVLCRALGVFEGVFKACSLARVKQPEEVTDLMRRGQTEEVVFGRIV